MLTGPPVCGGLSAGLLGACPLSLLFVFFITVLRHYMILSYENDTAVRGPAWVDQQPSLIGPYKSSPAGWFEVQPQLCQVNM